MKRLKNIGINIILKELEATLGTSIFSIRNFLKVAFFCIIIQILGESLVTMKFFCVCLWVF